MAKQRKRIGRPTKKPKPGKRVSLGLKVNSEIKMRLDDVAAANGRTQSQEAELRLERTFRAEDAAHQQLALAYGERAAAVVLMIARAMHEAGTCAAFAVTHTLEGSVNWLDVPYGFDQARKAANRILDLARPIGEPMTPPSIAALASFKGRPMTKELLTYVAAEGMGTGFANSILDAVQDCGSTDDLKRWGEPIREMLGDRLAERMGRWKHVDESGKD
jgi:hypothetical protein